MSENRSRSLVILRSSATQTRKHKIFSSFWFFYPVISIHFNSPLHRARNKWKNEKSIWLFNNFNNKQSNLKILSLKKILEGAFKKQNLRTSNLQVAKIPGLRQEKQKRTQRLSVINCNYSPVWRDYTSLSLCPISVYGVLYKLLLLSWGSHQRRMWKEACYRSFK